MKSSDVILKLEMGSREVSISPAHKRPAEDDLTNEQRLSKRFHLLNIDCPCFIIQSLLHYTNISFLAQDGTLYAPVTSENFEKQRRATDRNESMQVDESKDKVYIYDLEKELEEVDSEDEKLVFLPDIERKMSKIPESILKNINDSANKELVIYNVPSSLSVPEEQDNVRKAIAEARARAREVQLRTQNEEHNHESIKGDEGGEDFGDTPIVEEIDEDAMDIG